MIRYADLGLRHADIRAAAAEADVDPRTIILEVRAARTGAHPMETRSRLRARRVLIARGLIPPPGAPSITDGGGLR